MNNINEAAWKLRFWRMMREALYEDMVGRPAGVAGLTASQVEAIRFRYAHGESRHDLALEYKVAPLVIRGCTSNILRLAGRGARVRKIAVMGLAA